MALPRNKPRIVFFHASLWLLVFNQHTEQWTPIVSMQCERDDVGATLPRLWERYCQHMRDVVRSLASPMPDVRDRMMQAAT